MSLFIIDEEELDHMLEELDFLDALRSAGVDNWEGYDNAIEIFNKILDGKADVKEGKDD